MPCIALCLIYVLLTLFSSIAISANEFGTYQKPFAENSPWNSYPIMPHFSEYRIPPSKYRPLIGAGDYSTSCYLSDTRSPFNKIYPYENSKGIYDADAEKYIKSLVISDWPRSLKPAAGRDGHVDLFDLKNNKIHSFGGLKKIGLKWHARYYAWTKLDGRGWGDPAHYIQGVRATGVPTCAGIIRAHEINDGKDLFEHALSISLDYSGLSASPDFVFPATSADTTSYNNFGKIPEGALLMLPPSFDDTLITNLKLKKVVRTLKKYGAYVVDRNEGTPFHIYVEIGANWDIKTNLFNRTVGHEVEIIRKSLRVLDHAESWNDGFGKTINFKKNLNILSMRGDWISPGSYRKASYDTSTQSVKFSNETQVIQAENHLSNNLTNVAWAKPIDHKVFRFAADTTGNGKLQLILFGESGNVLFDSKMLANGESRTFNWPSGVVSHKLIVKSGPNRACSVTGSLIAVD